MPDVIHTYLPVTAGKKIAVSSGVSVAEYIHHGGYDLIGPIVCSWNNRPALRSEWQDLIISDDDVVIIIHLPQGGGGGSNPWRIAASIAIIALGMAAPQLMPGAVGWMGQFVGAKFAGALISAGVMVGGNALLNAVMPIKADQPSGNAITDASTAYSLSNPTNMSRLNQVIPVQYGRLKTTPPLVTQPWFEYVNNEQYVHLLLCLGQGEYELGSILFDTTLSTSISEATITLVGPGETCPYHDNVYSSPQVSGQGIYPESNKVYNELWEYGWNQQTLIGNYWPANPDWAWGANPITSPSGQDNTWILQNINNFPAFDPFFVIGDMIKFPQSVLNTGTYQVQSFHFTSWQEIFNGQTVTREGFYMKVTPDVIPESYNGYIVTVGDAKPPFFVPTWYEGGILPYSKTIHYDIAWPNGVFYANADGTTGSITVVYEALIRTLSGSGELGAVTVLGEFSVTENNRLPIQRSYSFTLPSGSNGVKYLVSVRKKAGQSEDNNRIENVYWMGLRVDNAPALVYEGVSMIAIRVKASAGLSNDILSKIGVIATRKLPLWNGTSWSAPTATRSIAWAAADACRNAAYSIGLQDANIDLDALLALDTLWTTRGDRCDGVFDTRSTFWESLSIILKTGRAQPHCIGGKITFTRDQAQSVIKGVFGIRNIVRGSFSIDYMMYDPDTPDDVEVEYLDEATWTLEKITCSLPGSTGEAPASVKKWGITQAAQATREGKYDAASNMYRRTFVTFQTELDARIIKRGDLVSVSHPLPSWGVSGEITGISGQVLSLSESVNFSTGDHYISFREIGGAQDGPYLCTAGADDRHVVLADPVPAHVYAGWGREKTIFQFGPGDFYERKCLVISARPRSGSAVELLCVVENNAVHTAEVV